MANTKCKLLFALALCFTISCDSLGLTLHLNLHRNSPGRILPGLRVSCGVLICEERSSWIDATSTPKEGLNGTKLSPGNISSMAVFKTPANNDLYSRTNPNNNRKYGVLLASVTTERPNLIRSRKGVKMIGTLKGDRARLRLELFEQADCGSQFTCQATGVDKNGKKYSSTSTLLQHQPEGAGMQYGGYNGLTSGTSLEQILAQRFNARPGLMTTAGEESHFRDRFESLEDSISLERRLEDRLNALENRIEDKIQHTILDKLYQIDAKLSSNKNDCGRSSAEFRTPVLDTLQQELKNEYRQEYERNLNKTSEFFATMEKSLAKNLTESYMEVIEAENIAARNKSAFAMSQFENALELLVSLASSFENKSTDNMASRSTPEETLSQLDAMLSRHLQSAVTDILIPSSCKKGMVMFPSGIFPHALIHPKGGEAPYLCDTTTDGGGWVILQRRATGRVDFYRDWDTYKRGFGSLDDEFWLGNDRIHALTSTGAWELRVDLKFKGKAAFAQYSEFSVEDERNKYKLNFGTYSGNAGDSLAYHRGEYFSTFDKDNDKTNAQHCAETQESAWWYNACDTADLNSKWNGGENKGIEWYALTRHDTATFSEMKIRRVY